jgi:hypothetical protein
MDPTGAVVARMIASPRADLVLTLLAQFDLVASTPLPVAARR